jgi:hypothetical protein
MIGGLAKIITNLSISRQIIGRSPSIVAVNHNFIRNFTYTDKLKPGKGVGGGKQFRLETLQPN